MGARARPPAEQWWVINGGDLLAGLERCADGETPDLVYLELYANSDSEDHGNPD